MKRGCAEAHSRAEASRGLVLLDWLRLTCEDSLSTRPSSRRAWRVTMRGNPEESPMGQGLPDCVRAS